VLHPYVGFVLDPEVEDIALMRRLGIEEPVNELGFYGPLPPRNHGRADAVHVGIFGGSLAAQFFHRAKDELRAALRGASPYRGKRVELYSFALSGFKQPQQLMSLQYLLAMGYHLDVAINLDGFNELVLPLAENRKLGVHPFFPRSWSAYTKKARDPEESILLAQIAARNESLREWRDFYSMSLLRHSNLALLLWELTARRAESALLRLDDRLRSRIAGQRRSPQERGPPFDLARADSEVVPELAAFWSRSSRLMSGLADVNGISYFHFLQPNQYVPGSKSFSPKERKSALAPSGTAYRRVAEVGYSALIAEGRKLAE
jgi:hypothetical protein